MQLEKISFFIWCTYGTYIHKLNKIWVFFLKKGGTSQAQGSQHWATIGANNSVHEKMEVWNEALTDFDVMLNSPVDPQANAKRI